MDGMKELDWIARRKSGESRTCLSYWFPRIEQAGLPVPRTAILRINREDASENDLAQTVFDGKPLGVAGHAFVSRLETAAEEIGFPVFLRTGQTSGKHSWDRTCYVGSREVLAQHVFELIEFSECADLMGLDWQVWVVRELLPTRPVMVAYQGMPVCREFRLFVDGPEIQCCHPYWPLEALRDGRPRTLDGQPLDDEAVEDLAHGIWELDDRDCEIVRDLASRAGQACGGRWSVDVLETDRGWYVTDLAIAELSWHWPGCPNGDKDADAE